MFFLCFFGFEDDYGFAVFFFLFAFEGFAEFGEVVGGLADAAEVFLFGFGGYAVFVGGDGAFGLGDIGIAAADSALCFGAFGVGAVGACIAFFGLHAEGHGLFGGVGVFDFARFFGEGISFFAFVVFEFVGGGLFVLVDWEFGGGYFLVGFFVEEVDLVIAGLVEAEFDGGDVVFVDFFVVDFDAERNFGGEFDFGILSREIEGGERERAENE